MAAERRPRSGSCAASRRPSGSSSARAAARPAPSPRPSGTAAASYPPPTGSACRRRPAGPAGDGPGDSAAVRFWRCANERAEAQAVAREIEHLLASGECRPEDDLRPHRRLGAGGPARSPPRSRSATSPSGAPGSAAFFGRPEVRDAIAWLRALADPSDSAAVVRALTRPPVELRSVDLARCTTIARRRKLDMISAVEAALESPQLPPPARERIRAFLKLYRAAAGGVRRAPRRRLRAAADRAGRVAPPRPLRRQPGGGRAAASTSRGWPSWPPAGPAASRDGSTRDFVRYLARSPRPGSGSAGPPSRRRADAVLLAEPEQVKGMEFDRVYLLGLGARRAALGRRAGRRGSRRAARGRAAAGRGRRRRAARPPRATWR